VSAFIAGGPPSRVVEQAIDGRLELVLADPVLAELERVLTAKFAFERERVRAIREFLLELPGTRVGAPSEPPRAATGDPDDDLILACAVAAGVEVLVSGDRRHLLPLGVYRDVRIITPQALLAELAGS
jgi:predicted nucleic acid-binding protein